MGLAHHNGNKYTPEITAHQLRHYYATLLDKAEVPMKARQLLMGHSDIHTTMQIYTHSYTGEMDSAAEALNNQLA
jgi:integrase